MDIKQILIIIRALDQLVTEMTFGRHSNVYFDVDETVIIVDELQALLTKLLGTADVEVVIEFGEIDDESVQTFTEKRSTSQKN